MLRHRLVAVVVATLCIVFPAAVAQATGTSVNDGRADSRYGINIRGADFDRVGRFYVARIKGWDFTPGRLNAVRLWIDVNPRKRGPEYRWWHELPADRDGHRRQRLERIDSWQESRGRGVPFRRWHTRVDYARDLVTVRVRRASIGAPKRVRLHVTTMNILEYRKSSYYGYWDYAPNGQRFPAAWIR
jgi:hypothetical protein